MSLRPGLYVPQALRLWRRLPVLQQEVTQPGAGGADPAPLSLTVKALLENRKQFLRFLERRVTSPAMAEDILQNAYMRALEHESSIRNGESVTAWFYRVLRNAMVDHYRRRTVEDRAVEAWAGELETEVATNDLTQDIVCQCIGRVVRTLKPAYAEILTAVDLEEGSLVEFAKVHSITSANATVRIHRARKALKQRLIETCGTCSEHACLNCTCRH